MDPTIFRRRIDTLLESGYHILSLEDALNHLQHNTLPACSVVLTFDDGFYSIYREAVPYILQKNIPVTIYVTTYYCVNQNPIFRLAIQYMFWKSSVKQVDLSDIGFTDKRSVCLENEIPKKNLISEIITFGEEELDKPARCSMAEKLGNILGVRYQDIVESRVFSIMNENEIADLVAHGIDIQLHTHRHRLPEDKISARKEIRDNRSVLEPLVGRPLNHLCYPSGKWSWGHFNVLGEESIKSAVTCDPGFNYRATPRFALRRFLDNSCIQETDFKAELCGMREVLRHPISLLRTGNQ